MIRYKNKISHFNINQLKLQCALKMIKVIYKNMKYSKMRHSIISRDK